MTGLRREVAKLLMAYWRGERNGKDGIWAVCPVCREQPATLGMGTWGHPRDLRLVCWNPVCEAGTPEVLAALEVQPDPWSHEGMLIRVSRVITKLEWQLRDLFEPPEIEIPGERRRAA